MLMLMLTLLLLLLDDVCSCTRRVISADAHASRIDRLLAVARVSRSWLTRRGCHRAVCSLIQATKGQWAQLAPTDK